MKLFHFICCGCFLVASNGSRSAEPEAVAVGTNQLAQAERAARQELSELKEWVDPKNYKDLGFDSIEQAARVELGTPMLLIQVQFQKKGVPGGVPQPFLFRTNQIIYPLEISNSVKSSLVFNWETNGWELKTFGRPQWIRAVSELREFSSKSNGIPRQNYSILEMPLFNLTFLSYEKDKTWYLIPAASFSKLEKGKPSTSRDIFSVLEAEADKVPYNTVKPIPR